MHDPQRLPIGRRASPVLMPLLTGALQGQAGQRRRVKVRRHQQASPAEAASPPVSADHGSSLASASSVPFRGRPGVSLRKDSVLSTIPSTLPGTAFDRRATHIVASHLGTDGSRLFIDTMTSGPTSVLQNLIRPNCTYCLDTEGPAACSACATALPCTPVHTCSLACPISLPFWLPTPPLLPSWGPIPHVCGPPPCALHALNPPALLATAGAPRPGRRG